MHTAPFSGSVVTMEGSDQERPGNRARSSLNRYRECRRNHAACLGRYAFDGCGEFLKSGGDDINKALLCAACGCHRSFHRKEWSGGGDEVVNAAAESSETGSEGDGGGRGRKRRKRTLLSDDQKRKMRGFAEKLGWKLQRRDEEEIHKFCSELGIKTRVFRVWLNNNRHNKGPGDGNGDIGDGAGAGDIGDGGAVTVLKHGFVTEIGAGDIGDGGALI